MLDLSRRIWLLLDSRERRNGILLLFMILGLGIVEVIGVTSVVPFLAVVADPDIMQSNRYFVLVSEFLGISDRDKLLVVLGVCVFFIVILRIVFTAVTHWAIARYSSMRNYTLSSRLLRLYMRRPYTYFLNRHSADLSRHVLSEVNEVVAKTLVPLLELIANGMVALFLILLLFVVDPIVAIVSVLVIGGAYVLLYSGLRGFVTQLGVDRVDANRARFQVAQEALGGIKNVKVLGLEDGYIKGFSSPAKHHARVQAKLKIVSELPQLGMHALVSGGMLVLVIWLLLTSDGDLGKSLPMIGLYAYAGTRLVPALQRVYKAAMSIRFGTKALDILHQDLAESAVGGVSNGDVSSHMLLQPIRLEQELVLRDISYFYPGSEVPALRGVNMNIPARSTVGLVGSTGAGKSTLVDLILGILLPRNGELLVDGSRLGPALIRSWQKNIGYVPQSIFLSDDTVTANIAFGVPPNKIDGHAVERAARIADLHEFVINEMPEGYATMVGERGVRLSGGQRQRIGIARALYHDPGVLIFDEATSALDTLTEQAVMAAVHNLGHMKTVILIAHRLGTVKACDTILLMDNGCVVDKGTYHELVARNAQFRAMAQEPIGTAGTG